MPKVREKHINQFDHKIESKYTVLLAAKSLGGLQIEESKELSIPKKVDKESLQKILDKLKDDRDLIIDPEFKEI